MECNCEFVLTIWHGLLDIFIFLSVNIENGWGLSSPLAIFVKDQFTDFDNILGGVPVFNRPTWNPYFFNDSVNPIAGLSPMRPAGNVLFPICINPPKNVPAVIMRALQEIFVLSLRTTFLIEFEESIKKSTTSPFITSISGCSLILFKTNLEYTIFKKLVSDVNKLNVKKIVGEYFKTEKNNIVHELYKTLEFKKINETKNGSKWIFDVKKYTSNSKANLIKLY